MPQLDRLIEALIKHRAEALVLEEGQKPSLLMAGSRRPIVATPLSAGQVAGLVAEIASQEDRQALAAGRPVAFSYAPDGTTVQVESRGSQEVVIRISDGEPAPASPSGGIEAPAPAGTAAGRVSPVEAQAGPSSMDELFHIMVEKGASDLHLCSGSPPMLRVDGEMTVLDGLPSMDGETIDRLLESITPERNRQEFMECNDTDFAYEIAGLCRFRCNIFRDRKGPGAVFRSIPSKILTVDDLNLSQEIRNLCFLTKGLVLVTGPTGSGKSTTLTALVDLVNKTRADHVITIEDPIEFVHENKRCLINQREVSIHTRDFKTALRAALREDPDIVLVGEMRDLETVAIAMETAETGHLVFGTLHTTSAVSTVDRLIDQFPADRQGQIRVMLAESLNAVIAQVLCKKKGGGRVAALELLIGIPAIANLIREGKTFQIPSIMQTGRKYGMVTLNDSLVDLVQKDVIEPQEAYMKALDKTNILASFEVHNIPADFLKGK